MHTIAVIRRWVERESVGNIADGIGVDRQTVSRHLNGHLPVSAKHMSLYLETAPPDLRSDLLGAWLHDVVPPSLYTDLLNGAGLPRSEVAMFAPIPDTELLKRMQYLINESAIDPDLRRVMMAMADCMGYEKPTDPLLQIENQTSPHLAGN